MELDLVKPWRTTPPSRPLPGTTFGNFGRREPPYTPQPFSTSSYKGGSKGKDLGKGKDANKNKDLGKGKGKEKGQGTDFGKGKEKGKEKPSNYENA